MGQNDKISQPVEIDPPACVTSRWSGHRLLRIEHLDVSGRDPRFLEPVNRAPVKRLPQVAELAHIGAAGHPQESRSDLIGIDPLQNRSQVIEAHAFVLDGKEGMVEPAVTERQSAQAPAMSLLAGVADC